MNTLILHALVGACVIASSAAMAESPISLAEAERLALLEQPQLKAQSARVAAAKERAVLDAQLPDPKLLFGVSELPINTDDRFSLQRDGDTDVMVGLSQEFPRASKRRLKGKLQTLGAERYRKEEVVIAQRIRRDTALAWIEAWLPHRAIEITNDMLVEASKEREAVDIGVRSGTADQTALVRAEVELELLRDRKDQWLQEAITALPELNRWLGMNAVTEVDTSIPDLSPPPSLGDLETAVSRHPELQAAHRHIAQAETKVALAQEAYKPDWRIDVRYGWRPGPGFSEMLTVMAGIDLPVFTRNRQDRGVAAALAERDTAEFTHLDHERALLARARTTYAAWQQSEARLARYDDKILPLSLSAIEAALNRYRANDGALADVLTARRAALDAELLRLQLQTQILRQLVELRYLSSDGEPS